MIITYCLDYRESKTCSALRLRVMIKTVKKICTVQRSPSGIIRDHNETFGDENINVAVRRGIAYCINYKVVKQAVQKYFICFNLASFRLILKINFTVISQFIISSQMLFYKSRQLKFHPFREL